MSFPWAQEAVRWNNNFIMLIIANNLSVTTLSNSMTYIAYLDFGIYSHQIVAFEFGNYLYMIFIKSAAILMSKWALTHWGRVMHTYAPENL